MEWGSPAVRPREDLGDCGSCGGSRGLKSDWSAGGKAVSEMG